MKSPGKKKVQKKTLSKPVIKKTISLRRNTPQRFNLKDLNTWAPFAKSALISFFKKPIRK